MGKALYNKYLPANLKEGMIFVDKNDWWHYLVVIACSALLFFVLFPTIKLLFDKCKISKFYNEQDENKKLRFVGLWVA